MLGYKIMKNILNSWDYLIVTASNEKQAKAYEQQLGLRKRMGMFPGIDNVSVVADPQGKRVGSGGSTIYCLMHILSLELKGKNNYLNNPSLWYDTIKKLRILIIHAGGDSKRLPAYGPCGKIFLPIPGEPDSAIPPTLFDRQLPIYLNLPPFPHGDGQVVITAGDVFLDFNPLNVAFNTKGVAGLGCKASAYQASKHGVFCAGPDGNVKYFLQKPTLKDQKEKGAVDRYEKSILDIGVMCFDANTAVKLLSLFEIATENQNKLIWKEALTDAEMKQDLDFYREICCAMGTDVTFEQYMDAVRNSGSTFDDADLKKMYLALSGTAFSVNTLPKCNFYHFGTLEQIISSGAGLLARDHGLPDSKKSIDLNNEVAKGAEITGRRSWIEGCRLKSTLSLGGDNIVVGVDINDSLILPEGVCLDVTKGTDRNGKAAYFIKCYGIHDRFKDTLSKGATICNTPLAQWLNDVGAQPADVWDSNVSEIEKNVWAARLFPAEKNRSSYRRWLWVFDPIKANDEQKQEWLTADRYSLSEIAKAADQDAFYSRRSKIFAGNIRGSLRDIFHASSNFSTAELAYLFSMLSPDQCVDWVASILSEARDQYADENNGVNPEVFTFARIVHTLGSSFQLDDDIGSDKLSKIFRTVKSRLEQTESKGPKALGMSAGEDMDRIEWTNRLKGIAFESMSKTIISSGDSVTAYPQNTLKSDEIVWGRIPARLDLGGGWTDTPPYSLEHGGCVLNAAVDLNGQPPIQVYARVIEEPVIRINSIDHGARLEIFTLDELLDYREPDSEFALSKAAIALSGFSPELAEWPKGVSELRGMLELFGGGIELTTLAAIPSGSGLGTSSIMGALLLSVLKKVRGRPLYKPDLFNQVLQLEQELTTGGGWQDQIGGVVDGAKMITTAPGLVPEPLIHYVTPDVLNPKTNNGRTLLFYTGIRRLAKNILHEVVGNYLDRNRSTMATLKAIHKIPPIIADAMARKDISHFGKLIDASWQLNKQLDPGSTTEEIENVMSHIKSYIHGAKLLGAGGGGFLLIVCRSTKDAATVRQVLNDSPPNARARFFDFNVTQNGLVVTVC
jgi:fucokinase